MPDPGGPTIGGDGLPPPPVRDGDEGWKTVVRLALAGISILLFITNRATSSDRSASSEASGAPSASVVEGVALIDDDFSDPTSGWTTLDDAAATFAYVPEGSGDVSSYHVLVKHARDAQVTGVTIDRPTDRVEVQVVARYANERTPAGLFGVGCLSSATGIGYDFLIEPRSRVWMIVRSTGTGARPLASGRYAAPKASGNEPTRIAGRCDGTGHGRPLMLVLDVNGHEVGRTSEKTGVGPFDGMELEVIATGRGGTDAEFDDARMFED